MLLKILKFSKVDIFLQQRPVITHIFRTRSETQAISHLKADDHSIAATGVTNISFVESIAAEWKTAKPFSAIPGPTKFQMIRGFMKGGEFHGLFFTDLILTCRRKYGDICLIPGPFGQGSTVSTFDPKDFERVHRTEGMYPIRPGAEPMVFYRQRRKDGFFKETLGFTGSGKPWADFRSKVNPVLMKPQNARLYLGPMLGVNHEFIHRIRKIRDPVTHEVPGDFITDINRFILESIAVVALDKELGLIRGETNSSDAQRLFESTQIFFSNLYDLGFKPSLYRYFPTPTYKRFQRALDTIFEICSKYVTEAVQRLEQRQGNGQGQCVNEEVAGRSVLEQLLKIDRKTAIIVALDLLLAGVDTTSMLLVGALLLLAKNPEKQAKLRAEIVSAVPADVGFTIENMRNLPYLRACIKEALRIYPIGPGNLRETGRDIVLNGYRVPQGTRVLLNSNQLLSEEKYFPRPQEFIPERWLRGQKVDADSRLMAENISPFVFLPFGFGPRSCAGKRIVDLEVELTLASLVRNFSIEFNYSTENAFGDKFIAYPSIPLKFKFSDL